jgi:hypothetical protein
LEHIINEATQTFKWVIPKKILSSNLLKAHFGKDLYTEIHASLNNLDKLRYLVNKVQQKQFPFGQGLLGIATEFWNGNKEFNGYLQEIGLFIILI